MREEANASNRARVGRGWIRRACLPCRRARGHLGRDWLGRTRRRRDRRHVGGCGRGRVVAGHDLTGRPRGARHRHAALAGWPKIAGPRGRESGERAADPDATAARAAFGRCRHRVHSCAVRFSRGLCASAHSWPRRCPKVACRPSSSRRGCAHCSTVGPSSRCGSTQSHWRPADASRSGATRASCRDVPTAVAASCAIPAFFAPVSIDGVRYVDGGVHSPTNADLVADLGFDLVVISSPMSIARGGVRIAPDQPARRLARFALAREAAQVRRAGTPVLTFQPTGSDLGVMGMNAMDDSRSSAVTNAARESAHRRLARPDAASPNGDPHEFDALSFSSSRIPASTPEQMTAMSGAVS